MSVVTALVDGYRAVGCGVTVDGDDGTPVVRVDDRGRAWSAPATALADRVRALVELGCHPDDAVTRLVASRPVATTVALEEGYLVLDWAGEVLRWEVVVPRGSQVAAWRPAGQDHAAIDPEVVRRSALHRSGQLPVDYHVTGATVRWFTPRAPLLATAALTAPQPLIAAATALAGTAVDIVISPPDVVMTAAPASAARLCDGLLRRHLRLTTAELTALADRLR